MTNRPNFNPMAAPIKNNLVVTYRNFASTTDTEIGTGTGTAIVTDITTNTNTNTAVDIHTDIATVTTTTTQSIFPLSLHESKKRFLEVYFDLIELYNLNIFY